jgi:hypothetical protein
MTATATKPAAKRTPKPRTKRAAPAAAPRVTKRELTLTEAADQWEKADREIERLQALRKEAAPVLLAHFEKTGRRAYKDRIALRQGADRTILDQEKVKEYLGEQLERFQTRVSPKPSLTRLQR